MVYPQYDIVAYAQKHIILGQKIEPGLFSDVAQEVARACSSAGALNASSQVRRFYDEIVMWDEKINSKIPAVRDEIFSECAPYIWMITAKLAYAKGRKLITDDFQTIFTLLIKQINNPQTLKQAKTFFEAYIGFAKSLELKETK